MLKEINFELCFSNDGNRSDYGREILAENIMKIINSKSIDITPLMIDGAWGVGKTEFCIKLKNKIEKEHNHFNVIYFSAFDDDYSDNPVISILSEIKWLIRENETLLEKFKKAAVPILINVGKELGKAAIFHLFKKDFSKLNKDISEVLTKSSDALVDDLLKSKQEIDDEVEILRKVIMEIASEKEIIFIIDELDRCKPTYSINLLESIKHLFNIKNVHFILSANKQQLKASINGLYGNNIDSSRYLDKFLLATMNLPELIIIEDEKKRVNVLHFTSSDKIKSEFENDSIIKASEFIDKNISLRDVEKYINAIIIGCFLFDHDNENHKNANKTALLLSFHLVYFYNEWVLNLISANPMEFLSKNPNHLYDAIKREGMNDNSTIKMLGNIYQTMFFK